MARNMQSCCVALFLMLAANAAVPRRVNSIKDLPTDALTLLYWLVQNVNIHSNPIRLNFDPSINNYGSHHYGNYEGLLDNIPRTYQYFTIGNINDGSFPDYVRNANEENRARIIIRVRRDNNRLADRVYITRHTGSYDDSNYDPQQTYEVTVNVLQELARLSRNEIQRRALDRPFILQVNESRDDSQAHSFSNQRYYTPATGQSCENSCGCIISISIAVVFIIFVILFLMARNVKT